jgi:hypothetical protein
MNARFAPVACLVLALALPEVALARAQPPVAAAAAPAAGAPVATPTESIGTPAPVVAAPAASGASSPTAVVVQVPPAVVSSPPPPRLAPTPPPRLPDGKQMIVAGASTLGTFYFFSSLGGALTIDRAHHRTTDAAGKHSEPDRRRINFGRALMIPVAGPFVAMGYADTALQRWGAALTGAAQLTGAVLVLAGMVRKARARRWERVSLGAGYAAGGATVSLAGRF